MRRLLPPFLLRSVPLALLSLPGMAWAITSTLGYSGRLFDAAGTPATGQHDMMFRLYDAATDGELLFEESFAGPAAIAVVDGYFYALLANNESGTMSLDEVAALYDEIFIELTVDGGLLEPRQATSPVPWALVSGLASGGGAGGASGDRDTLGSLSCSDGQIPSFVQPNPLVGGVWSCGDSAAALPTCASSGEVLKWDGVDWVCGNDLTGGGGGGGAISWIDIPDVPLGLVDVGDAPAAVCADGEYLGWDDITGWTCSTPAFPGELDPRVGTITDGQWCVGAGGVVSCTQAPPTFTESDPEVATLQNGGWCTSDGSRVSCTQSAPVLGESDPEVGTIGAAGNWCRSDGSQIHCDQSPPSAETDPYVGTVNNGGWCVGGPGGVIDCTNGNPDTDTDTNAATLCATGEYLNGDGNCYPTKPTRVAGILTPGQIVRLNNRPDTGVTMQIYFGHLNTGGDFTYVSGTGQDNNSYISGFAWTSGSPVTTTSFVLVTASTGYAVTTVHGRLRGGNDSVPYGSVVLENNDSTDINYVAYMGPSTYYPY